MEKLYFLGEFGYIFRQLLPFLEINTVDISLVTWPSVCYLINLLWPNRYDTINIENIVKYSLEEKYRDCTHFRHVETTKFLETEGFKHFFSIDPNYKFFYDDTHKVFNILNKKLIFGKQNKVKRYISIFPRKRSIRPKKNIEMKEHIKWIKSNYQNKEIIGHGFYKERFDLNIKFTNNISEQINVFNNSEFLISPPSGLVDFALCCGCNIILIGEYKNIEKTNPHNCIITKWKDL